MQRLSGHNANCGAWGYQALLDLGPDLPFMGSVHVEQGDAQSRTLLCTVLPTGSLLQHVRARKGPCKGCCAIALSHWGVCPQAQFTQRWMPAW